MEVSSPQPQDKVIEWLADAQAMEHAVLQELDGIISAVAQEGRWPHVEDAALRGLLEPLERHRDDTERHEQMLHERLHELGASPSRVKEAVSLIAGLAASFAERAGSDKAARAARYGFATEHLEIATYEMLERLAERAGDAKTAELARGIRAEEQAMAARLADSWDSALQVTLAADSLDEGTTK